VASYFFYGWWDWRFLSLLVLSTALDYGFGLKIHEQGDKGKRKAWLVASVCANLGILGFFKYFNFFAGSLETAMHALGWQVDTVTLRIVLPVGISFYTFQSMSYTIDVYRRDLEPVRRFWDYALYVSFFPQLVAGPIERATHLLPQVVKPRTIVPREAARGAALIGWGLFKKVIVADSMARIVNQVFGQEDPANSALVWVALYAFAIQIYGDFSGYSDIARGLGKIMGFDIMRNFNLPYFAENPQDFWRRWHISLSTWLRDYLYIPLGGSRKGRLRTYVNLLVTMVLGGLWHGASWHFVVWGLYHGILLAAHRAGQEFLGWGVRVSRTFWGLLARAVSITAMFHLVCFGWILFRADSMAQVGIFLKSFASSWVWDWETMQFVRQFCFYGLVLVLVQLVQHGSGKLDYFYRGPALARISLAALVAAVITISAGVGFPEAREFIYFQF
jgi:D-alanyl-lipoteichoic acid acyltransferase DltB (MBOAT superfamily)